MGWESRDYAGDGGGGRGVLRRIFGDGENPLDWSLPLYTAWGIRVRIHLIFVIMIIARLLWSIPQSGLGPAFMLMAMGSLFVLVLLHEYGHCFACRWVGGSADKILMWPLGGLAYCAPPHTWQANLVTVVGGPGVNAVLLPVLGVPLWLVAGREAVLFNPFDPGGAMARVYYGFGQPYWLFVLWWFYYTNWALFAFNMLLPMYPMDCGRIVQCLMWRKMGFRRSMQISVTVGLVVAVALFVVGTTTQEVTLLSIALFGGLICWYEKKRLAMTADEEGIPGYDFSRGYQGMPRDDDEEDDRSAAKRRAREQAEQDKLDTILAKIAREGMGSLTWRERAWLKRTTEKRRRG